MDRIEFGVIGGSGLYQMKGLENLKEVEINTPFGRPSDVYSVGQIHGKSVAFLARHGRGHKLLPSDINFRANIAGFKKLGVRRIFSASAVGSLRERHKPMDFVLPDQFFDRTRGRLSTFFGGGIVAHIGFADPICFQLMKCVEDSALNIDLHIERGGTYVCMEGPAFSTRAESHLYRSWGMDLIGMTNLQEAKLAREAELCYLTIAMVTDYDCWHEEEQDVSVETLIGYLNKNSKNVQKLIKETLRIIPTEYDCVCQHALENAIISDPKEISEESKERLKLIVGKYL